MKPLLFLVLCAAFVSAAESVKVRISFGHQAKEASAQFVKLTASGGLEVVQPAGFQLEANEPLAGGELESRSGGGDVDGVQFDLVRKGPAPKRIDNLHIIWSDLIAGSPPDMARRLATDASMFANPGKLTVQMDREGTRGFSVTLEQLLQNKAIWIPSLDVYVTAGESPTSFEEHLRSLQGRPKRILEELRQSPEATYEQYTARWEDMGHPLYTNPQTIGPGHIVGVTWDSAIPKFGIDRGAGVWNDYGNPDRFQLWYSFADMKQGIADAWKSQKLQDGLPVITTVLERDGVRYEVEQFAYPLDGPPSERKGDIKMVLMQKVRLTELTGKARKIPFSIAHRRQFPPFVNTDFEMEQNASTAMFRDAGFRRVMLAIDDPGPEVHWAATRDYQREQRRLDVYLVADLAAGGTREYVVKLPSPVVSADEVTKLAALKYDATRGTTLKYWNDYVARGAQFRVPEKVVNDLFRANLWHALRLPRRHGGKGPDVRIDLPYSNFAYSQTGTPWPVNQAIYVDYMLYDLRGYHDISAEEVAAQYRNNQEQNGHINGYANWGVYTPSMLYTTAQHYLLSGDRGSFDRLLPASMRSLDWCLEQVRNAAKETGPGSGLIHAPLNDLTGEGWWAFNQAYMYAGLELFGRALEQFGHPRATEARQAAKQFRTAIDAAFRIASMQSPIVPLRDGTWIPYVPAEAKTPRRLFEQWYVTDADTGSVHLLRLKGLDAEGELAESLLNDHEDNLFYKNWGIANEPIYNQHATAYLLRDDAKAAIRTFYSYMASAFSHSVLEPVEHRWTHGQYFGPPSTDGAWFELYRNMLVHERDDGALVLGLATPRAWLEHGKTIEVERAPTHFGALTMRIRSNTNAGRITAEVDLQARKRPQTILVRLRHPGERPIQSVTVNGRPWKSFNAAKEWVEIPAPDAGRYVIEAAY